MWRETPLEVVCNNHSPAPIYGGYQPRTVCIVVLVMHLVLSVLAALGICVGYMYCGVLGAHLVQEGRGPCKIPNFSHLLWSYRTYMYFVRHVRIDLRQS